MSNNIHLNPYWFLLGALFDTNVDENKRIFQYAIERVNENLLAEDNFKLEGQVAEIVYGNEITISRGLCGLLEQGVSAIFGPEDTTSSMHAANICDTKDIPYIDTRYDAFSMMPVVNMYPAAASLQKLITDIVLAGDWKSFTILYEQPEWLPRVAELLKLYDPKGYTITVRRLDYGFDVKNYRAILRRVKMSSDTCIIIDSSIESLPEIMKQAQQIGIMIDKYNYIITNLDAHTIDLEPYQYSGANITVLRTIDTTSPILASYAEYLKNQPEEEKKEGEEGAPGEGQEEGANENGDGSPNEDEPQPEAEEPAEDGEESKKDGEEENGEAEEGGENKEEDSATSTEAETAGKHFMPTERFLDRIQFF